MRRGKVYRRKTSGASEIEIERWGMKGGRCEKKDAREGVRAVCRGRYNLMKGAWKE